MEKPSGDIDIQLSDPQDQIQRWQERATSDPEQQAQGIIARLFVNCQGSLRCLVRHLDPGSISRSQRNTLRRSLSSLQLWSDGHGVTTGTLDATLDRSRSLRLTTLSILNPMCRVLSHGSYLVVIASIFPDKYRAAELCSIPQKRRRSRTAVYRWNRTA